MKLSVEIIIQAENQVRYHVLWIIIKPRAHNKKIAIICREQKKLFNNLCYIRLALHIMKKGVAISKNIKKLDQKERL